MSDSSSPSPPASTSWGLLPEGVHDFTLDQVRDRYGRFQHSDRRVNLFEKLKQYVEEVRKAGWDARIVVNGSFIMEKVDEPDDIDLILVLPPDWDMDAEVRPFEYNLISRKRTRKNYEIEVLAVRPGSEEERKWLEYFEHVNIKWNQKLGIPFGTKKGLVEVVP